MTHNGDDIEAAMVRLLYRQSHGILFANFVIPAAVVYALRDTSAYQLLLAWMAAIYVLTFCRIGLSLMFFRHGESAATTPKQWVTRFTVFSWLSAALWGFLGSLWLLPPDPEWVAFACIVLAGMACGAMPGLSARLGVYVGFMTIMILPFVITCLLRDEPIYGVFLMFALALYVVNVYFGRVTYRNLLSGVQLRFENVALIGQLERERDRANAANLAKTRFLAAASHDLRQPLHALGLLSASLSAVAERGDVGADGARQLGRRLDTTLERMGGLLDGLLDVSRLDAGLVTIRRRPLPLATLLDDIRDEYVEQARRQGCRLDVVVTEAWIDSDPELLRRILDNLLSNAIRYAPMARILVGARRRPGAMEIQVIDSGPGIAPEAQALVFEEFAQLTDAPAEQGLGLGLAIVRRLAGLLGHPISLRSVPGKGSNFSVTVPLARDGAASAALDAPLSAFSGGVQQTECYGVMLVDDDPQILSALNDLLKFWGHLVYAGATVEEVCAAHQRAREQGPAPVHLVLADFRLANQVTGDQAIAWLREYLDAPIPGLIVTGDTAPDRLRALHASGYRVLHKPISADALRQAIAQTAQTAQTVQGARDPAAGN
ncbi:ATP-binding protein [Cupriavidus plantarum]|uniref:ATP-binding protein n=1 Tax=Cupriavidus plantarum TaxID=942865 RepID=UPI0017A07B44|nr:ATP-binding protein [Cupriavidus plantarum]NYI02715.1 hypothetical protein [Cupriavidus plantarum]